VARRDTARVKHAELGCKQARANLQACDATTARMRRESQMSSRGRHEWMAA
jgi:hypothetical protein